MIPKNFNKFLPFKLSSGSKRKQFQVIEENNIPIRETASEIVEPNQSLFPRCESRSIHFHRRIRQFPFISIQLNILIKFKVFDSTNNFASIFRIMQIELI